ncbi:cell division protein FtsA [Candidatus Woesebacteria bacterium RIFCSPLOWO2_01_FULL_39_23]|uniref:Cell division protein FtsA n=1 Tax=Candidatus Woesebacteria bacterium RIFCSPHIGHO2_01_FULL_40_22 TaxID=1802499 RepID=A0A1F7YJQ6_9BACT|nr:MAG: cell division protein FtsA [Candidatus Woesebacteria bacterium RBG_16_40_11]OGM27507.1 MAG: cell division protein FtsA [Candidatus Woesebacteria bacterium RIFCSPHIGHO2_01_FULL_40_22]OGM36099.1 MAG: cell division protein FtsA [Candidatus Woesebacteria bacterium RIFCSPHIGHO2_12_FULL_38_9]OGM62681.1 MAG: cell division protein FtsA [Candidatus Woesebacteria bacterium RIFCSPLOWO2_01_FULL_39_23]
MAKPKTRLIAGIDLGSSKISTVIAHSVSEEGGLSSNLNVVGVATSESKGIRKGQIVDPEEAIDSIIESIEAAERMAGYNLTSAYVSLGGANVGSQNSHGVVAVSDPNGEIVATDVDRVIEAASAVSLPTARELVHVIPREFVVDGEVGVKNPVGMSGIRLEVETHIVSASSAAIKNVEKVLHEAGIQIEEMVFTGLAASEAVLTKTEKELGCVLIDIGGGTTSVAAYIDGALASSFIIPIGSKNVTNDLAIGLRLSLESAEKVKISLSRYAGKRVRETPEEDQVDVSILGADESKKISKKTLIEGIIKPRLNEIFSMVKIQLDRDNLSARIPSGAIIAGGGANVIGCEESAKRVMGVPTRIGKPRGVSGLIDDIMNPAFATPVGLILWGASTIPKSHVPNFTDRLKLPTKGFTGKLIEIIKDLLP